MEDNNQNNFTNNVNTTTNKPLLSKTNLILGSIALISVITVIVLIVLLANPPHKNNINNTNNSATQTPTSIIKQTTTPSQTPTTITTQVAWTYDGNSWTSMSSETLPPCPSPLVFDSPTNLNLVTNILYPGQVRGGDYKAHGGFRFDGKNNSDIKVTLPMDATLYRGVRYIESGEVQYMFDFIAPCGIFFRFDHLLELSDKFKMHAESLPQPNNSSATTILQPVLIRKGEVIATSVGFLKSKNVSFDFGVYDLRQQNEISKNPTWSSKYSNKKELGFYGICWLDHLTDSSSAKALPGSGTEGKKSDYCK